MLNYTNGQWTVLWLLWFEKWNADIQRLEQEYAYLLDDRLTGLAWRFGVEPQKLISHVLQYKLMAAQLN